MGEDDGIGAAAQPLGGKSAGTANVSPVGMGQSANASTGGPFLQGGYELDRIERSDERWSHSGLPAFQNFLCVRKLNLHAETCSVELE